MDKLYQSKFGGGKKRVQSQPHSHAKRIIKMATPRPINVDSETESQTDSEFPQLLKKRKPAAGQSQISQNILRTWSKLYLIGKEYHDENNLPFWFYLTPVLEISRFEVLISRFLGSFFKHSRLAWFRGWKVWVIHDTTKLI